jgi:predicted nucleic-acid-binding Zn-ribbon protein
MRRTQTCPKCQERKFLVIRPFRLPNFAAHQTRNRVFDVPLVTVPDDNGGWAVQEGEFEAWVCAACGLTEWYACSLEALLQGKAEAPGANARIVDAGVPGVGPFR